MPRHRAQQLGTDSEILPPDVVRVLTSVVKVTAWDCERSVSLSVIGDRLQRVLLRVF